jgi:hypothetical protein
VTIAAPALLVLPELGPPGWIALGVIGLGVLGVGIYHAMSSDNAGDKTDAADKAAEKDLSEADAKEPCLKCEEEKKRQEEEQKAKDAKRMSDKELDKAAKNNGYKDAHDLKKDFGLDSKYDIFKDGDGNLYSGPRQGTGVPQPLGINASGGAP